MSCFVFCFWFLFSNPALHLSAGYLSSTNFLFWWKCSWRLSPQATWSFLPIRCVAEPHSRQPQKAFSDSQSQRVRNVGSKLLSIWLTCNFFSWLDNVSHFNSISRHTLFFFFSWALHKVEDVCDAFLIPNLLSAPGAHLSETALLLAVGAQGWLPTWERHWHSSCYSTSSHFSTFTSKPI